jgi:hypothetical protein
MRSEEHVDALVQIVLWFSLLDIDRVDVQSIAFPGVRMFVQVSIIRSIHTPLTHTHRSGD